MWRTQVAEQGYAVIPNVLSASEISRLADVLSAVELPRSRAGARHLLRIPAVAALASDPKLLEIARRVLGDGAFPFRATLFDKSPDANWLIVWHQDTALPLQDRRDAKDWGPWSVKHGVTYAHAPAIALSRILALRVHLDDSTLDNGPLRVLPGTHRSDVLTDEEIEELANSVMAVNCTIDRGGIIAMRPLIIHASSKSSSPIPRRVVHIEYAASCEMGDGLQLAIA